jgi:hypothetical protein
MQACCRLGLAALGDEPIRPEKGKPVRSDSNQHSCRWREAGQVAATAAREESENQTRTGQAAVEKGSWGSGVDRAASQGGLKLTWQMRSCTGLRHFRAGRESSVAGLPGVERRNPTLGLSLGSKWLQQGQMREREGVGGESVALEHTAPQCAGFVRRVAPSVVAHKPVVQGRLFVRRAAASVEGLKTSGSGTRE